MGKMSGAMDKMDTGKPAGARWRRWSPSPAPGPWTADVPSICNLLADRRSDHGRPSPGSSRERTTSMTTAGAEAALWRRGPSTGQRAGVGLDDLERAADLLGERCL